MDTARHVIKITLLLIATIGIYLVLNRLNKMGSLSQQPLHSSHPLLRMKNSANLKSPSLDDISGTCFDYARGMPTASSQDNSWLACQVTKDCVRELCTFEENSPEQAQCLRDCEERTGIGYDFLPFQNKSNKRFSNRERFY